MAVTALFKHIGFKLKSANPWIDGYAVNAIQLPNNSDGTSGQVVNFIGEEKEYLGIDDSKGSAFYLKTDPEFLYAPQRQMTSCTPDSEVTIRFKFVFFAINQPEDYDPLQLENLFSNALRQMTFSDYAGIERKIRLVVLNSNANAYDVFSQEIGKKYEFGAKSVFVQINCELKFLSSRDCDNECGIFTDSNIISSIDFCDPQNIASLSVEQEQCLINHFSSNNCDNCEQPLTFESGLTRSGDTITNDLITGINGGQTIIGGTGVTDKLTYKGTTGNGTPTAVAHQFDVGNNGGTTSARFYNDGTINIGTAGITGQQRVRVGTNTGWWDVGSGSGIAYLWSTNTAPTASNFSFAASGTTTYVGASTLIANVINGVSKMLIGATEITIADNLYVGGLVTPTAAVHIKANSTTISQIRLTTGGSLLTTATPGSVETDANGIIYYTPTGTDRRPINLAGGRTGSGTTVNIALSDMGKIVNCSNTNSVTVNLPAANSVPAYYPVYIKDSSGNAGTNARTVTRAGADTIEGSITNPINQNYQVRGYYSDGISTWYVI